MTGFLLFVPSVLFLFLWSTDFLTRIHQFLSARNDWNTLYKTTVVSFAYFTWIFYRFYLLKCYKGKFQLPDQFFQNINSGFCWYDKFQVSLVKQYVRRFNITTSNSDCPLAVPITAEWTHPRAFTQRGRSLSSATLLQLPQVLMPARAARVNWAKPGRAGPDLRR